MTLTAIEWDIYYDGHKTRLYFRKEVKAMASKLTEGGKEIRIIEIQDYSEVDSSGYRDYWTCEKDITVEVTGRPPLLRLCAIEWQDQLQEVTHYTEDDYYETWEPRKIITSPEIYCKCTSRDEDLMNR